MEWSYTGLLLEPVVPQVSSLVVPPSSSTVAVGIGGNGAQETTTYLFDLATRRKLDTLTGLAPFSLVDGHSNLAALLMKGEQAQVMIKQDGAGGFGFRFLKIPLPQGAIATFPYQLKPAHFALDGTLLLPGIGRDRLYRINPALGTSTALLPETPVDILDFDVTPEGDILILDGFEQQLVWMDLDGAQLTTVPLLKREKGTPEHLFFSVAAAPGRTAWVGVAIRQPTGIFAPELQRVTGKLKQRLTLDRGAGTVGYPLVLSSDGAGGVVLSDELNTVMQVDASVQPGRPWQVLAPGTVAATPSDGTVSGQAGRTRIYITEGGRRLEGLDQAISTALPDLNVCYERLRQVSKKAKGTYKIALSTRDRGIERVEVVEKNFDDFGLESCVSTALKKVKFGNRVGQHTLRLALHFLPPDRG